MMLGGEPKAVASFLRTTTLSTYRLDFFSGCTAVLPLKVGSFFRANAFGELAEVQRPVALLSLNAGEHWVGAKY